VVAATNCAFPPYEYYENGVEAGIDVDIVKAVCEKLGYDLTIVDTEFGSIIAGVATGKYDIGFGAITITEERAKSVHFTTSYSTGIQSIIVKEDSPITTVDDLHGDKIKIGVQQDTTGDIYATGDFGEDHIARFNKGADAVQALLTGKCDAVIIDNSPAETFVAQNKGLKILPTVYAEEEYGFELSYDNEELYNEVNGALEELLKDGTVQKIVDKYINAD
jgi:polar amino acid transport system substrate-binding protein